MAIKLKLITAETGCGDDGIEKTTRSGGEKEKKS